MHPAPASQASFARIANHLYLALFDSEQADRMAHHSLKSNYIIVPMTSICKHTKERGIDGLAPSSLIELYKFDAVANRIARQNEAQKLVFATGRSPQEQKRSVFLIGCHLIMSHGLDTELTITAFKTFKDHFLYTSNGQISIHDCWYALERAKSTGWIDFQERFQVEGPDAPTLDMEEFIHYSWYSQPLIFVTRFEI